MSKTKRPPRDDGGIHIGPETDPETIGVKLFAGQYIYRPVRREPVREECIDANDLGELMKGYCARRCVHRTRGPLTTDY